jgi:Spy/CpxP family protein refolding chaperone
MKNRAKWLAVAVAMTGIAGAVYAQTTSNPNNPAASGGGQWRHDGYDRHDGDDHHWRGHHHRHGHHGHRHHGPMMGGMMLHTLHQLNLTDAQRESVHGILAKARSQFQAQHQKGNAPPNFAALANPGDPNHAAALQALQARLTARIQARDQVQQQIYGVLTASQKTQLASILAAKQARFAQHSAGRRLGRAS